MAEQYKPQDPAFVGLFLVIISRASGVVWDVKRTSDGRVHGLTRHYRSINHIFFHLIDPEWGHITIRISSHPRLRRWLFSMGTNIWLVRPISRANSELTSNCFSDIMTAADLTWLLRPLVSHPPKGNWVKSANAGW
ncbi:MAG: hypothetical protein HS114_29075 [Anaerolineales bacterium]|nr:hypothetical protein [Anaerolineales bacterium]